MTKRAYKERFYPTPEQAVLLGRVDVSHGQP
ncbi:helix-turn-helix domain-containing protein [Halomonas piscis]